MKKLLLLLLLATPLLAATKANDDSCDLSVMPAATLLLPYFEVDLDESSRGTTLFSITNVTNVDRVAHVTLWTDHAYPVLDFNIFLTGYDVQSINLYDVLARGIIAPPGGTGTALLSPRRGPYSDLNPALDLGGCVQLPGVLDEPTLERMRRAFTEGVAGECATAGGRHARAVGYATIDVVGSCTAAGPGDPAYWTRDLRYDNVLIGETHYVEPAQGFAQGTPMVHIRAVPEGGTPELRRRNFLVDARFERTFYGRYQPADAPRLDARQPLPAQFAARWIDGGPGNLGTSFKVWRESAPSTACADLAHVRVLDATDVVVFDEDENAAGLSAPFTLPATSLTSIDDGRYPRLPNGALAGWMYMNLDAGLHGRTATQNWVVTSMRALGRYSTDIEASALGNGCAPAAGASNVTLAGGTPIAPANDDDSCDIALFPAATLLLPYFEVDLSRTRTTTTLFTVTNTGPEPRIARVTLWTDYSFPILTFNVALGGHDVQSLNLFDVLQGEFPGVRDCAGQPVTVAGTSVARMQRAFTEGELTDFEEVEGCDEVGNVHQNAVGYATIDVVRNCAARNPQDAAYWTTDIAYDNVLIGDYQQIRPTQGAAQGAPLVHIRAIPGHDFPRTFYGRYQSAAFPHRDARQPLPSQFAVRWIQNPFPFGTFYKIWREGTRQPQLACGMHHRNVTRINEIVRFDEQENPVGDLPICRVTCIDYELTLPATSRTSTNDASVYPQLVNGAPAGWMFLNLDNDEAYTRGAQAWVIGSMFAEERYATDIDAAALGNGCSPAAKQTEVTVGTAVIGPAP
ncbi:MAG TPA: hypothetical protein VEO54_00970 [Thermoanaerobaculia bacterium]|nr:hypothetical protein [Thermoanaerobaculia bacterium]